MLFKEKKLSTNLRGFLIISSLLFTILTIYFMGNYNRFGIYNFSFNNQIFSSNNGIAYFTPNQREISLSNINYLGNDNLVIRKMNIGIYYVKNGVYQELTSNSINAGTQTIYLKEYLGTVVLNYEEKSANKLNTEVELFLRENTYVVIDYITSDNKEHKYEIKINTTRLANNKLFY